MERRRAFTLVELLTVMGIIAVVMALLLPSLGLARGAAQQAVCMNALRQHGAAALMYRSQFRTYLPAKIGLPADWPGPPATTPYAAWFSMPHYQEFLGTRSPGGLVPAGLICPRATLAFSLATASGYPMRYSYGYNTEGLTFTPPGPVYYTGYREGGVRNPAEKLMFADATDWVIAEWNSAGYPQFGEQYGPGPLHNLISYRHSRGVNILFFDGHGARLAQEDVINNDRLWHVMD